MPGLGKTSLALEFAHRYQNQFETVYWLACDNGSLSAVAAGLARQLGLRPEGDLTAVLALHKKGEALCLELNSQSGLAYCYWRWGQLARAHSDDTTAQQKLQTALDIFTTLKMPREREAVATLLSDRTQRSRA